MTRDLAHSEPLLEASEEGGDPAVAVAARVAVTYLNNTQQASKSNAFAVFYELASRTAERAPRGLSVQFTAANLKEAVAASAQKDASGWISPHWSRLTELEPQWQEGLSDTARSLRVGFIPKLAKVPGSPAHYLIEALPLTPASATVALADIPRGGVRYTPEAVAAPARWLGATLRSGVVRWTLKARLIALAIFFVPLVLLVLYLWFVTNYSTGATAPLSLRDLFLLFSAAVGVAMLVQVHRFVDELFTMRIVMAPDLLTPITQSNVTLEVRRSAPGDEVGELAFVRYTALCPKCDGSVDIESGRLAYPERLIGRCRRSGREHIYSFDHVLRIGRPLID